MWRSIAIDFSYKKKEHKLLYYWAEVEEGASNRTPSIKTVYLHQNEATFALQFEPWILDSLSQVYGYQKITFGDDATLNIENHVQCMNNDTLVPMSSGVASRNFWFDNDFFQNGVFTPRQINICIKV